MDLISTLSLPSCRLLKTHFRYLELAPWQPLEQRYIETSSPNHPLPLVLVFTTVVRTGRRLGTRTFLALVRDRESHLDLAK